MTGVAIRAEEPADRLGVREVLSRAFSRDEEAQLVEALREGPSFVPGLSLVALDGPRVVGHVLFTRIHVRAGESATEALSLAPLAVVPERQSEGIGTALVEHGLAECRRLGHRIVVVLGHPTYYPRFGFIPAGTQGIRARFAARPETFMVLELVPGALDGVRGQVEYPEEFDQPPRGVRE